jgi:hypothetical protein
MGSDGFDQSEMEIDLDEIELSRLKSNVAQLVEEDEAEMELASDEGAGTVKTDLAMVIEGEAGMPDVVPSNPEGIVKIFYSQTRIILYKRTTMRKTLTRNFPRTKACCPPPANTCICRKSARGLRNQKQADWSAISMDPFSSILKNRHLLWL